MNFIEGEWGLPITVIAILFVAAIFGGALWFILSAEWTNRKFRKVQKQQETGAESKHEPRADDRS